jgi:hypothetical protein
MGVVRSSVVRMGVVRGVEGQGRGGWGGGFSAVVCICRVWSPPLPFLSGAAGGCCRCQGEGGEGLVGVV